ncbi:hypothetical protein JCM5296_005672 [Sporobolomyces johnsonii]
MSFPPPQLHKLAERLVHILRQRNETVSIVETATGGLVSSTILSLPGTSAVFAGGVAAYQLAVRKEWLGWTDADTKDYTGPSEQIVLKLAQSCRSQLKSTYCIAESAVAGPGRPDVYRPEIKGPGYCPLAVVGEGLEVVKTVEVEQPKSRPENMVAFAEAMFEMLIEVVEKQPPK